MSRHKSNNVDYFPHFCKHGKLLFILENEFGNDGYAFFYKLYEILGDEDGHSFRAGNAESWSYLLAITKVEETVAASILCKLSKIGTIDKDLWEKHKIIWSQPLVDSLKEVYRKRSDGNVPLKPILAEETPPEPIIPAQNEHFASHSGAEVHKGEYSKEKKRKINKRKFVLPEWIPEETWQAYLDVRLKKRAAQTDYAFNLVVKELEKIKKTYGHDPVEVLNKSITNGWTDVYPLKEGKNGKPSQGGSGVPREYAGESFEISPQQREANILKAKEIAGKIGRMPSPN